MHDRPDREVDPADVQLSQGADTTAGCDRPPSMCHVHHDHPWSRGGHTSIDTARLLCG